MDLNNKTPIYLQLADEIKVSIFAGDYKPGERLPSVRDFAMERMVNSNTAQRALAELEREGLIITERTNGKYVTDRTKFIESERKKYAAEITEEYREKMKRIGVKIR